MIQDEIIQAALLGIIEGLTEFIPVSSTGHLIIIADLLAFTGSFAGSFEVFIQLGAILAVVFLYAQRFKALMTSGSLEEVRNGYGFSGWVGITKLFLACLPAFVLGALLHGYIKSVLFGALPVACALLTGGVIMVLVERREQRDHVTSIDAITYRQSFLIGVFQCFALWPGMSRSGSTIVGGMFLGLNRTVAAEFSFLVAVPVMCAAVAYDLLKSWSAIGMDALPVFAVGFVVSFITAIFAIKFFLSLLRRFNLAVFGYYRIVLALLIFVWLGS